GLIGRAGSGKTTVARALASDGAALIEADQVGHEVTDGDPDVRAALIAEYGPAVYPADGALDRAVVAGRGFRDRAALARLDQLVHPRIVARLRASIDRLRAERFRGLVVVDAALMLQWGFERECDAVLAVVVPEALQLARLEASRGWTEDEARARIAAQPAQDAYAAAADVVLDNSGGEDELRAQARGAVRRLVTEVEARRPA